MAYSTRVEVRQLLQGVVEASGNELGGDYTPDKLSDEQVDYEIKNADEQINTALRRNYKLPLALPVPMILNTLSIDIAAALCDMTFRASREYANELSPFRLRYERANLILERIAEGTYTLYNEGEGPNADSAGNAIVLNPYEGNLLLDQEVFPRGGPFTGNREFTENVYEDIPHSYSRGRAYLKRWGHY